MPDEMMIADYHGVAIVVAHRGQSVPDPDRLRHEFGITDSTIVRPISQTDHAQASDEQREAALEAREQSFAGPAPRTAKLSAPGVSADEHQALLRRVAELEARLGRASSGAPVKRS